MALSQICSASRGGVASGALFALVSFLFSVAAHGEMAVSQFGITWQFDSDYQVGRFVNGDYYVVDEGRGVTIRSVSPGSTRGRNGSVLNPTSGGLHAFDDRVRAGYEASVGAVFPLQLKAGDALVSTISASDGDSTWDGSPADSKARLRSAAVLTIVGSRPPEGSFRPSYVDRKQKLYSLSDLKKHLLPRLDASTVPPPYTGAFSSPLKYFKRGLERPWLLFVEEWPARDIHPVENMYGYHTRMGEFLSELYVYLLSDLPIDDELLIRATQLGIDYYHVGISGKGDSSYWTMPVLWTGLMLDDTDMLDSFLLGRVRSIPRDYPDFYFASAATSNVRSLLVAEGTTWQGFSVFFRNNLGPNREYEHLYPSEWQPGLEHWKDNSYRLYQDSHPHIGMVLAARVLGLRRQWHHDATFAYADRWMKEDHKRAFQIMEQYASAAGAYAVKAGEWTRVKRSGSAFVDSMWGKYRFQVAPPSAPLLRVESGGR